MRRFSNHIIVFFILCLSFFTAKAADLTVALGETYRIDNNQTQNFGNVLVFGQLIVEENSTVNLTGIVEVLGGSILVETGSTINVQGALFVIASFQQGVITSGSLSIEEGSSVTAHGLELLESSLKLDGGSSLTVLSASFTAIITSNSSILITGNSSMTVSTIQGMNVSSGSTIRLNNGSKMDITNGNLVVNFSPQIEINGGSSLIARKNISVDNTTLSALNGGIMELYANGTFSASNVLSFNSGSEVRLLGGNQTIDFIPQYYNLVLGGTGNKSLIGQTTITNKLNLGSRLLILNNLLSITNPLTDAIERTSGFIVSGFVKRAVNAQSLNKNYIFPVGILNKYRPVLLKPVASGSGFYSVEYHNGAAGSLTAKIDQILTINNGFYHKIYKEGNAPKADVTIFYESGSEGPFNRVVTWNPLISKWDFPGNLNGTISATPNIGITSRNVTISVFNNLNPGNTLFALASVEETPFIPNSYGTLKKQLDGSIYVAIQDTLRFRFEEEYAVQNSPLTYTVFNKNNLPVLNSSPTLLENMGDNRFKLNVSVIADGEYAVLEVKNKKGEKWSLRFRTKEF